MGRDHDLAFQPDQPFLGNMRQWRVLKGLIGGDVFFVLGGEGIGGEFGMALPLQAETSEIMKEVFGLRPRPGDAEMGA